MIEDVRLLYISHDWHCFIIGTWRFLLDLGGKLYRWIAMKACVYGAAVLSCVS